MTEEDFFRGYPIKVDEDGRFIFSDTGKPVEDTWKDRPCGHCGLYNTAEGHDGCLGTLPGVLNACCGHGNISEAYVQFEDGESLREKAAIEWINAHIMEGALFSDNSLT